MCFWLERLDEQRKVQLVYLLINLCLYLAMERMRQSHEFFPVDMFHRPSLILPSYHLM